MKGNPWSIPIAPDFFRSNGERGKEEQEYLGEAEELKWVSLRADALPGNNGLPFQFSIDRSSMAIYSSKLI